MGLLLGVSVCLADEREGVTNSGLRLVAIWGGLIPFSESTAWHGRGIWELPLRAENPRES